MRRIVFCHGKESGPRGFKIRELTAIARQCGWQAESIDFTCIPNPDRRAAHLQEQERAAETEELILVGSSMGGYVAALASAELRPAAIFLMAPAVSMPGYRIPRPQIHAKRCVIVHGWLDAVVPVENVLQYAAQHRAELHVFNAGHNLHDAITEVKFLFRKLLDDMNR
ncbi:MAG: alpha/beta hydrolase [Desulfuromonadales bacterium]|nr:alpha/beta hydrolase [Desulfuromonadales bacterium]